MNDGPVDVSVLVPTRNEAGVIEETAGLILGQQFDGTLEFLFVDGHSTDGTRAILEQLAAEDPRVRVLDNPHRVVPAALNRGLARARGQYVVRMDAHAWYPLDYIATGVSRLQRGDVPWVSGPAVPRGEGMVSRAVALALGLSLGRGGSRKWTPEGESETELDTGVFGGVWRRETLIELGGWEETWTVNEDAEMAGRVLEAGSRIVCVPKMAARYAPRDRFSGLARQYWRFGHFRVKTSRSHPVALRRSHVAAAALAAAPGLAVVGPRRANRAARIALGMYAALLARAAARLPAPANVSERAAVAAALAIMHLSWGAGFIAGCLRFGLPLRGFLHASRIGRSRPSAQA